ncbi:MAG TPA: MFS transporter, partial [Casimicrobiaceae bacterium]|nr:MFS transporter [Casimicrobiaceae bacterium]
LSRYAAFVRLPDVARLLAMAIVARMPLGTVTLALLLHVRALTGSFAAAGAAVGAYLGTSAAVAPIIGRWIDRRGVRAALIVTGIACPAALLVLWLAGPLRLSTTAITLVAAFAGAFAPPITVLTRTMWRYRFSDADARKTAFALDSVLIELAFTVGPGLIALLLAVGSPVVAFGAAWVFTTIAVPLFLASPALRYWRHDPHAERHLLGPLTEFRLLGVFATTFLLTMSLGLLEISYPGFAAREGNVPLAGVLLAINSAGSAIGGLLYGGLHVAPAVERQLRTLLAIIVAPLALHSIISSAAWLCVAAFIAGLCIAPALTIVTLLVSSYAPTRYGTEAFTWSATCIVSGIGAGNALGGYLLERFEVPLVFGTSAAVALLAAGCAMLLPLHRSAKRGQQRE